MGRVPDWDEVHGWHEFVPGWQGPDWCNLCDCPKWEHTSSPDAPQATPTAAFPFSGM